MRWQTAAAAAEVLQERIWDLHDKLSHAILSLSTCARRRAAPGCRCCVPNGCVVVKGRWPQGGEDGDLAAAAAMADARSLHAIRAALDELEGHLLFLHSVQLQQRAEQDDAIARLQQSRILLATRLAEHRGKRHGVIEEALAFVSDVLDKRQFVPEDVYGMHSQSGEIEEDPKVPKGHGSNMVVRVLSCSLVLAKNSLRLVVCWAMPQCLQLVCSLSCSCIKWPLVSKLQQSKIGESIIVFTLGGQERKASGSVVS